VFNVTVQNRALETRNVAEIQRGHEVQVHFSHGGNVGNQLVGAVDPVREILVRRRQLKGNRVPSECGQPCSGGPGHASATAPRRDQALVSGQKAGAQRARTRELHSPHTSFAVIHSVTTFQRSSTSLYFFTALDRKPHFAGREPFVSGREPAVYAVAQYLLLG